MLPIEFLPLLLPIRITACLMRERDASSFVLRPPIIRPSAAPSANFLFPADLILLPLALDGRTDWTCLPKAQCEGPPQKFAMSDEDDKSAVGHGAAAITLWFG